MLDVERRHLAPAVARRHRRRWSRTNQRSSLAIMRASRTSPALPASAARRRCRPAALAARSARAWHPACGFGTKPRLTTTTPPSAKPRRREHEIARPLDVVAQGRAAGIDARLPRRAGTRRARRTRRNSSSAGSRFAHCARGGSATGGAASRCVERGDQRFLPGLAFELPDAERRSGPRSAAAARQTPGQQRDGAARRHRSRRVAADAGGLPRPCGDIAARSAGPSSAAAAASVVIRISGIHKHRMHPDTAAGRANSTASAANTTTKAGERT